MSKNVYRLIDLCVFTVLTVLLEALNLWMLKAFNEVFALSICLVMTAIIMMRWQGFAIIPAALSGVVYAAIAGGNDLYIIYAIGNCFTLFALWFVINKSMRKRVMENYVFTALYFFSVYLLASFGRAAVAGILSYNFVESLLKFMLSDLFNLIIGFIIMFVVRRQNGLFENQNDYLQRVILERDKEDK